METCSTKTSEASSSWSLDKDEHEMSGGMKVLARQLASEEKTVRVDALKKLKAFISSRVESGDFFEFTELKKLWKCLYYCLWMCDTMVRQEKLSKNFSTLTKLFKKLRQKLSFIKAFFVIIKHEWLGLDTHRQDKFLFLIRMMFRSALVAVEVEECSLTSLKLLSQLMSKEVFCVNSGDSASTVQYHVCDIYFDEVSQVLGSKVDHDMFMRLCYPFLNYLKYGTDSSLCYHVIVNTFLELTGFAKYAEKKALSEKVAELKFDRVKFADHVMKLSLDEDIAESNRGHLLFLLKRWRRQTAEMSQLKEAALNEKQKRLNLKEKRRERENLAVEEELKKAGIDLNDDVNENQESIDQSIKVKDDLEMDITKSKKKRKKGVDHESHSDCNSVDKGSNVNDGDAIEAPVSKRKKKSKKEKMKASISALPDNVEICDQTTLIKDPAVSVNDAEGSKEETKTRRKKKKKSKTLIVTEPQQNHEEVEDDESVLVQTNNSKPIVDDSLCEQKLESDVDKLEIKGKKKKKKARRATTVGFENNLTQQVPEDQSSSADSRLELGDKTVESVGNASVSEVGDNDHKKTKKKKKKKRRVTSIGAEVQVTDVECSQQVTENAQKSAEAQAADCTSSLIAEPSKKKNKKARRATAVGLQTADCGLVQGNEDPNPKLAPECSGSETVELDCPSSAKHGVAEASVDSVLTDTTKIVHSEENDSLEMTGHTICDLNGNSDIKEPVAESNGDQINVDNEIVAEDVRPLDAETSGNPTDSESLANEKLESTDFGAVDQMEQESVTSGVFEPNQEKSNDNESDTKLASESKPDKNDEFKASVVADKESSEMFANPESSEVAEKILSGEIDVNSLSAFQVKGLLQIEPVDPQLSREQRKRLRRLEDAARYLPKKPKTEVKKQSAQVEQKENIETIEVTAADFVATPIRKELADALNVDKSKKPTPKLDGEFVRIEKTPKKQKQTPLFSAEEIEVLPSFTKRIVESRVKTRSQNKTPKKTEIENQDQTKSQPINDENASPKQKSQGRVSFAAASEKDDEIPVRVTRSAVKRKSAADFF